jgi:23S rRNA (cytidine1920-2'-O)/16S rRNA (cytidine1409-2'-O)-methyltransferase
MKKVRIDKLLVDRGLAESRSKAQRLVMAGQVRVNDQLVYKSADSYPADVIIEVQPGPKFVSRGGEKLAAAINYFDLHIQGKVCADVGASTGGFSDCLLQNGARKVYAIDVGRGILHWKIRQDARVVVMEGVNARYLAKLPEAMNLVTIDASFISLKLLLPVVHGWLAESGGEAVVLIKPQFEVGRDVAARNKGVIRDRDVHKQVLLEIVSFAMDSGFKVKGLMKSPLKGPKGNVEFLCALIYPDKEKTSPEEIVAPLFNDPTSLLT